MYDCFCVQVIKNPVTDHLPAGVKKIVMSYSAGEAVNPQTLIPKDEPVVMVVGAMAHGKVSILHFIASCHRLVGLVVKASASRAEGPGFESRLRRNFFRGRVIPVT